MQKAGFFIENREIPFYLLIPFLYFEPNKYPPVAAKNRLFLNENQPDKYTIRCKKQKAFPSA